MIIHDKESFCKKVGYIHNIAPCLRKLRFYEKYGIREYLKYFRDYDFVLGSELLLKKAIQEYGSDKEKEIFEDTRQRLSRKPGHIFVETGFKRANQTLFSLAVMEGVRNIFINREDFDSKEDELNFIQNFVKKHYQKNNGKLKLWGKIKYYVYSSQWFEKVLLLDVNGNVFKKLECYTPNISCIDI